jgi:hypothetical protein
MITANLLSSLQPFAQNAKRKRRKYLKNEPEQELEDYKLVEEFEGTCDDCNFEKEPPKCPICDGH